MYLDDGDKEDLLRSKEYFSKYFDVNSLYDDCEYVEVSYDDNPYTPNYSTYSYYDDYGNCILQYDYYPNSGEIIITELENEYRVK